MACSNLVEAQGLRIAVEGCGHGTLHSIYASVAKSCKLKQWPGVDLLIIGGDFQAVRNAYDLKAVSMPEKYYDMADFHEYYSGKRTAPFLTIFIGGNHEASNYLWELYYGGWVAPNIYYMGAANVIRLGPLRIAGLSGIWKGYNYKKPHFERLPYNQSEIKSIYHVRELDVRKLMQIRSQVDVGLSHDWPRGMEWKGNHRQLFKFKPYFEQEAKDGTLGSVAATQVLERLRPQHWFSAHMHAKYSAVWEHKAETSSVPGLRNEEPTPAVTNTDGFNTVMDVDTEKAPIKNAAEIDLDLDEDDAPAPAAQAKNEAEIDLDLDDNNETPKEPTPATEQPPADNEKEEAPVDLRSLLPESFARPTAARSPESLPFPSDIRNKTTRFLALDKCLPNRHFLQLLELAPIDPSTPTSRPLKLEYDAEWLAITRTFASDLVLGDPNVSVPPDRGDVYYRPLIEENLQWVKENLVKQGNMTIPEDFERTAPVYDPSMGIRVQGQPREYTNPHTLGFCEMLQIPNPFLLSEEEREKRMQQGPRPDSFQGGGRGRGGGRGERGGRRGSGRGRGRGRGRGSW